MKTPERRPAVKRGSPIHDDGPDLKKVILGEKSDEEDGMGIDYLQGKLEDQNIVYRAVLGHDLTEVYCNKRLMLAANRHLAESILSTDVSEIFSPERVTAVCAKYGLAPGQAMDIKNGSDFDLEKDRKKA